MSFAFGFTGDDIDADPTQQTHVRPGNTHGSGAQDARPTVQVTAFPIQGKPQLAPLRHDVQSMLLNMPSKIAFGMLHIRLDDEQVIELPRRELWDIKVQAMAEEDHDIGHLSEGLGEHDVKTGVYEGGFKSWESSVDLVKVLASRNHPRLWVHDFVRIIELGCGTALPSLALLQWVLTTRKSYATNKRTAFILADYNPTVLQLVTLPNLILTWALSCRDSIPALQSAFSTDDELELTPAVLGAFQSHLSSHHIELDFLSGGWSEDFIELLYSTEQSQLSERHDLTTILLGAETIYSPFALQAFTEVVLSILKREKCGKTNCSSAWVAAKRLYFGVGGSLDDFVDGIQRRGASVAILREEVDGVRRGVVHCTLP